MKASRRAGRAGETFANGKWPKATPIGAVTSFWLLFGVTTAAEAPRLAPAILQQALLACALVAPVGFAAMYATDRHPVRSG